jgi:hypothetical protein
MNGTPEVVVDLLQEHEGFKPNQPQESNRGGTGRKSDWSEAARCVQSIIIHLEPDTMQNEDWREMTMTTAVLPRSMQMIRISIYNPP